LFIITVNLVYFLGAYIRIFLVFPQKLVYRRRVPWPH